MLVFIDESGSPGVKQGQGATALFTIAILLFQNGGEAAKSAQRIADLRRELRLSPDFEFHFNDCKDKNRSASFEAIAPMYFSYFAATIDKVRHTAVSRLDPSEFFRYACGLALAAAEPTMMNASVTIDATAGAFFASHYAPTSIGWQTASRGRKSFAKSVLKIPPPIPSFRWPT